MGNWRSVDIVGSISPQDAPAAAEFVNTGQDWDLFHCLCYSGPSLCGLGPWIPPTGGQIRATGNLSERNYGPEDVAVTLEKLVAIAPSLELKVHCGGDWEDATCVATVTVHDGVVSIGPPEVAKVGEIISDRAMFRLGQIVGGDVL